MFLVHWTRSQTDKKSHRAPQGVAESVYTRVTEPKQTRLQHDHITSIAQAPSGLQALMFVS